MRADSAIIDVGQLSAEHVVETFHKRGSRLSPIERKQFKAFIASFKNLGNADYVQITFKNVTITLTKGD